MFKLAVITASIATVLGDSSSEDSSEDSSDDSSDDYSPASILAVEEYSSAFFNEIAAAIGFTVNTVTEAELRGMSEADIAMYSAVFVGDSGTCESDSDASIYFEAIPALQAAVENGRMVLTGLPEAVAAAKAEEDGNMAAAEALAKYLANSLKYVAGGKATGLFIGTGCTLSGLDSPTYLEIATPFCKFAAKGTSADCLCGADKESTQCVALCSKFDQLELDESSPLFAGVSAADLSGLQCTVRAFFPAFATSGDIAAFALGSGGSQYFRMPFVRTI